MTGMNDYVIFTDSGCDISPELLGKWKVELIELLFRKEGGEEDMRPSQVPVKEFYDRMRAGEVFKTAAANENMLRQAFVPMLRKGLDVLYVCFSSGLSGTFGTAKLAAEELMMEYPERRILVIDTLCASAGEGLLLRYACAARDKGASMYEVGKELLEKRPHLAHWFTVDDLVYLKRGGRVGSVAAFFGGVLNIKPVLHVDDEGHLIPMQKVRGRINSIKAIVKKYRETALDPVNGAYFISHGDSLEDAERLERMIFDEFGKKAELITDIGPVIGAHSGPGTLALFYLSRER